MVSLFLADYHVHTSFSHDCRCTMADMAAALLRRGMTEACFTDHIDIVTCTAAGFRHTPDCYTHRAPVEEAFRRISRDFQGKLTLKLGIELSGIQEDLATARRIAADPALDMIIGSIHNLRGVNDFAYLDYSDPRQNEAWAARYLDEYVEVARSGCCDILGHVGYITRYMARQGAGLDWTPFLPRWKPLFQTAVENGVGIEVNTSGLRGATRCTFPQAELLRLYRQCGGELITVGSDTHTTQDAGYAVAETYELLRELGFRYVTVFRKRKPEWIQL